MSGSRVDLLLQESRWRRCKGSSESDVDAFVYFATNYAYIQHPKRGAILFDLREAQIEVITSWMTEDQSLVLKARQIGYSTLVAVYSLWLCLFWNDRMVIMLSKGEREAHKLLAKSNYAYLRLPVWMRERGPQRLDKNVGRISFDNGSSIESLPSKEDPARSSTASLVVVDEWAFLDNPEEAWAAIEPVTDVGGRIIGLSTANGAGNFFHTLWLGAVQHVNGFVPLFFPWHANSDRDDAWYTNQKRKLPGWQLAQEYPDNPEEAFLKSGNPVFDSDLLRTLPIEPPLFHGSLSIFKKGLKEPEFNEHSNGALTMWRLPEKGHSYVIGADVAEGLEYGDYSAAHVKDVDRNEVVACWHEHIDADLYGEELAKLGFFFNTAFIGVEVNNHGLTTNKALQRLRYPYLYVRHELDSDTGAEDRQEKVGWYTSRVSKPLIIDSLNRALREGLKVHDEHTVGELLTYVRNGKGGMEGSPFDDRVMSLAITEQMSGHAVRHEEIEAKNHYWTFEYFLDKVLNEGKTEGGYVPIGHYNRREWDKT